jgi:hypothetical protein
MSGPVDMGNPLDEFLPLQPPHRTRYRAKILARKPEEAPGLLVVELASDQGATVDGLNKLRRWRIAVCNDVMPDILGADEEASVEWNEEFPLRES